MIKKYLPYTVLFLFIGIFWSVLFSPAMMWIFAIPMSILSLGLSISSIFEKHNQTEGQGRKIARDTLLLIVTLVLAILLAGGPAAWVGAQAAGRFDVAVGFICALAVSFAIGYLVRKGIGKLS